MTKSSDDFFKFTEIDNLRKQLLALGARYICSICGFPIYGKVEHFGNMMVCKDCKDILEGKEDE